MCMLVSLLERLVLDLLTANNPQGQATQVRLQDPAWRGQLNLDVNWDGWRLLDGVVALRHCFAHEFGRVTARQRNAIVSLQADLGAGGVSVTLLNQLPGGAAKQVTIAPFFKVDSSDNILLDQDSTSKALRLLCLGVLRQLEHQGHIVL